MYFRDPAAATQAVGPVAADVKAEKKVAVVIAVGSAGLIQGSAARISNVLAVWQELAADAQIVSAAVARVVAQIKILAVVRPAGLRERPGAANPHTVENVG